MSPSTRLIPAILLVVLVGAAFWVLALSPKREQASDLSAEIEQQQAALAQSQAEIAEAVDAQRKFPSDYKQLVVLGKAVPAADDTSSLLVEVNQIARDADVRFESIQLSSAGGGEVAPVETTAATPSAPGAPAPPTEVAASLLPLGATIGPAGLGVMPYDLIFTGSFSHVADFIKGIDALVHTSNAKVEVDGRLITLDGFALNAANSGFPNLEATFAVTTYLVPPGQGVTAGATAETPAPEAPATEAPAPSEEAR